MPQIFPSNLFGYNTQEKKLPSCKDNKENGTENWGIGLFDKLAGGRVCKLFDTTLEYGGWGGTSLCYVVMQIVPEVENYRPS